MQKKALIMSVIAATSVALILSIVLISKKSNNDLNELPIETMSAEFIYDTKDIRELIGVILDEVVGITDYVFVGVVSEEMETEYKNETHYFIEGEERIHADPLTKYKIQVLTNIKGELLTDEPIELKKDGGIALDGKSIYLYPGDTLPVVGKTYIFSAFCQKNGTLIASGPNSTVEIDENNQTEAIESFKKAYEDEIVPMERERFISLYDVNHR